MGEKAGEAAGPTDREKIRKITGPAGGKTVGGKAGSAAAAITVEPRLVLLLGLNLG